MSILVLAEEMASQNKPRFPAWALFPFTGATFIAEETKTTYCSVEKTLGGMDRALRRWRLLSPAAFPMVKAFVLVLLNWFPRGCR